MVAIAIHFAQLGPISRVSLLVPPLPAMPPSFTSGSANEAFGVQNRKSTEPAISTPAPRQRP